MPRSDDGPGFEALYVGPEDDKLPESYNKWPDPGDAAFRDMEHITTAFYAQALLTAQQVLDMVALSLAIDRGPLREAHTHRKAGASVLQLCRGLSPHELPEEDLAGWAHKTEHPFHARGTLCLYFPPETQASPSGYEVRCADGGWEPLQLAPHEVVVGVGQMLTRYTNGRLPTMAGRGRPSIEGVCGVFALFPDDDAIVDAVPDLQSDGDETIWAAEKAGQIVGRALGGGSAGVH